MPKRVNGWFGWRPDKPDIRDFRFSVARRDETLPPLPTSVDLRSGMPPCYDQGNIGSCTANAIGALLQFNQRKQGIAEFTPSRLFIYYNERVIEGTVGEDAGAEIRDGIKSVNDLGAPPENVWKYVEGRFTRKPTRAAFRQAMLHQALKYERIANNLHHMQSCLAEGFPFAFGFSVYESFEGDAIAATGIMESPLSNEQMVGGHAVVAVGYDDERQVFLIRNSWGTDWGTLEGHFWMGYNYITEPNLADDFWRISLVES